MKSLTRTNVIALSKVNAPHCISIFMPVISARQPVHKKENIIRLRNLLNEVKKELSTHRLKKTEIEDILTPVRELTENTDFWDHQSEGLALFLAGEQLDVYALPVSVEPIVHVSTRFYLLPVFPIFNAEGAFFLLSLELGEVRFYRVTRYEMKEMKMQIPENMGEAIGTDYKQKMLHFRTHHDSHGLATYHSQGEGKDDRKEEIVKFFRAVDKGLRAVLHHANLPLLLVTQDYLFSLYREINTYPHLIENHLSVHPSVMDRSELRSQAWEVMDRYFSRSVLEKKEQYQRYKETSRTSVHLNDILSSAINGKVDTLFVQKGSEVHGIFNPELNLISDLTDQGEYAISLANVMAAEVFRQKGRVFVLEKKEMPDPAAPVNALYRSP